MMNVDTADFAGKVAFITGAGSGIGRATAIAFADQGTHLIVADRYADDDNHATVDLITSQHGSAIAATCDVTNSDDTQAALQQGVDTFGRLDIAFNNAGVELRPTPAADISEADWNRVRDHPIFCVAGA
jgi:NAD(P)-dependent dehydrogenase (short-subunit alcohol dehydrogenase family)